MKTHHHTVILLSLAASMAVSGPANAITELIFSDNYNVGTSSDLNLNLAARQGGTLATRSYTAVRTGTSIASNQLATGGNTHIHVLGNNLDFTNTLKDPAYSGFTIHFDARQTTNDWSSPYLSTHGGTGEDRGDSRLGLILFPSGSITAYSGTATTQANQALNAAQLTALLGSWNIKDWNSYSWVATKTSATTGTYRVFINGTLVFDALPYAINNTKTMRWSVRNISGGAAIYDDLEIERFNPHPLAPSPENGEIVPGGDVPLSWTNLAPNTGSDVWVDVWFGSDPDYLTQVVGSGLPDTGLNTSNTTVNVSVAGTYYWRVDSYLDGDPEGTPVQTPVINFIVFDGDGDGIPDWWETLYFDSPTGAVAGTDDDKDDLTNLQEYQAGLHPKNPDTDNDGLLDGDSITVSNGDPRYDDWGIDGIVFTQGAGERTFRGEIVMGTDPLKPDTDGDGLTDGKETNTGIWVGSNDTGTNPLNPDTDGEGLRDGVETHTGVFLSLTNTGTNPLLADSDGDGVSDWYEVAIIDVNPTNPVQPNSPNDPTLKPITPYPLPVYDGSTGVTDKPVKVYILSGQSNMLGYGRVSGTEPGTLTRMVTQEGKFPNLRSGGAWVTRNDVRVHSIVATNELSKQPLSPTWKGDSFGPELGFGTVMGWRHDEPVLLIKPAIGSRALGWDYLPPESPSYTSLDRTYAGYGESGATGASWLTASESEAPFLWYAGKQFDDYFLDEADMGMRPWVSGTAYPNICAVKHNGVAYLSKSIHTADASSEPGVGANWSTHWNVYSLTNTVDILDNFASQYPEWAAQGFEISGYVWWQGYNDISGTYPGRYQQNMARFIEQIRLYYANRYPDQTRADAPFVLATLATGGWGIGGGGLTVANGQLAVDGDAGNYPGFAGNVKTMEARGYWRDFGPNTNQGYHYNHNAETYLLVGDALGRAMVELQENAVAPGDGYASWVSGPFSGTLTDTDPTLDFDGGGLATGLEWVLGGDPTDPTDDAGLAPAIDSTSDPDGKIRFTFRRSETAHGDAGTTITVQYGDNLAGWTDAVHQGTGPNDITLSVNPVQPAPGIDEVTVALPPTLAPDGRFFARLMVGVAAAPASE